MEDYYWKIIDKLTQYGLLKRANEKWGKRLTAEELEKAEKWLEEKINETEGEQFSSLVQPMHLDHYGWRFGELATYGLRKVYHPGTDYNDGHNANDDLKKPISFIADGVVTYKGYGNGWGWHVFVLHNIVHKKYGKIKVWSHYAHLYENPPIAVGENVKCGQQVLKCGKSGTQSPHLHFELRKKPLGVGYFPYGKDLRFVQDNYYNPEIFF